MKKKPYLVSGIILFFILVIVGFWCTLNNVSYNRITGQFVGSADLNHLFIPWIGVMAFVTFVIILNLKKFK